MGGKSLPPLPASTSDAPDVGWIGHTSSSAPLSTTRCLVCHLPPGLKKLSSPKQRDRSRLLCASEGVARGDGRGGDGGGGGDGDGDGEDYALFEEGTFSFPGKEFAETSVEDFAMHVECIMYNTVCPLDFSSDRATRNVATKLPKLANRKSFRPCVGCRTTKGPAPTIKCARRKCARWYHWPCVRWLAALPEGAEAFVDPDGLVVMCATCKARIFLNVYTRTFLRDS